MNRTAIGRAVNCLLHGTLSAVALAAPALAQYTPTETQVSPNAGLIDPEFRE